MTVRRGIPLAFALATLIAAVGCATEAAKVSLPYSKTFAGECRWPEERQAVESRCGREGYELVVVKPDEIGGSGLELERAASSLAVEALVRRPESPRRRSDELAYGVACLANLEEATGYVFLVTNGGQWQIVRSRGAGVPTRPLRHGSVRGAPERIRGVCGVDARGRTLLGLELDGELVASATDDGPYREFTAFGLHLLAGRAGARVTFAEVRAATVRSEEVEALRAGSNVLFEDDFSEPQSRWWGVSDDADAKIGYADGAYRMRVKGDEPQWSFVPLPTAAAIVIEADAWFRGGPESVRYGVACYGDEEVEEGYVFTVSPSGGFAVFEETREEVVIAEEGSGAFDGRRRALRLRATCEPRRGRTAVTLSVDGTRVAQATRAGGPPAFGVVGFYVHGEPGGSEVEFDNVRVVTLGE